MHYVFFLISTWFEVPIISPDSEFEEGNTKSSHKRTFSTGPNQKSADDKVDDPSATNVDIPPPKKTKLESEDTEITANTPDDGDDLVPLTSKGPNVFYGYTDSLFGLLQYGEDSDQYWLKKMIMDKYKASQAGGDEDNDDDDFEPPTCAGITSDSEELETPEAKLLLEHFESLSGMWFEMTVKRQKPEGMRLQVTLESSKFDQLGYIYGGNDLGEWWISDIKVAEGESLKAMETVRDMMFWAQRDIIAGLFEIRESWAQPEYEDWYIDNSQDVLKVNMVDVSLFSLMNAE